MPAPRGFFEHCPRCDTLMKIRGSRTLADGTKLRRFNCEECGEARSVPSYAMLKDRFNLPNPLSGCSNGEWRCFLLQCQIAWEEGWRMDA